MLKYMDEDGFRGIIDATIIAHIGQSKLSQFVVKYPKDMPDHTVRGIIEAECSLLSERLGCVISAECLNFDNSCMITIGKTYQHDSREHIKCPAAEIGLMQKYNNGRYPCTYAPLKPHLSNRELKKHN